VKGQVLKWKVQIPNGGYRKLLGEEIRTISKKPKGRNGYGLLIDGKKLWFCRHFSRERKTKTPGYSGTVHGGLIP